MSVIAPVGFFGSSFAVQDATFTTKQNDYEIGGANVLRWNGAGSTGITGIAAKTARTLTIVNASTDYLLWLENENTASVAANRWMLPDGFPALIMPGDTLTGMYDGTASRWRVVSWPTRGMGMGLGYFTDFNGEARLEGAATGTGASIALGATGSIDTTERALGAALLGTGTLTTGRAGIGQAISSASMLPTLGAFLSVSRAKFDNATDGTETFSSVFGVSDSISGTITDAVAWEYRWNGAAAELAQTVAANTVIARSTTGGPTVVAGEYLWLGVFINPSWSAADFLYSTDSINVQLAGRVSSGLPGNTRHTAWMAASIVKSAGTTNRQVHVDLAGYRTQQVRG